MYVLVRDGVEFWSTPLLETDMPSVKEGECAPYEDGELWNIADDEFVSTCELGFKETENEVFTLSNWERVKGGVYVQYQTVGPEGSSSYQRQCCEP